MNALRRTAIFTAIATSYTLLLGSCGGTTNYPVGGSVSGLASGTTLTLQLNDSVTARISQNGSFAFGVGVKNNIAYSVSVLNQPTGQVCNVSPTGYGIIQASAVSDVAITCYNTAQMLYSFSGGADGNNGAQPGAGLTFGPDGALYGTTNASPAAGHNATVFKVTTTGDLTVLYNFPAPASGTTYSVSALTLGMDGNFYGTTSAVSDANGYSTKTGQQGTVFKVSPAGQYTLLYTFGSHANDGTNPLVGVAEDVDGNLYGITFSGGSSNLGAIFRLAPDGSESVLQSIQEGPDSPFPLTAPISAQDGGVLFAYVDRIAHFAPDGTATTAGSFTGTALNGGLIQEANGNVVTILGSSVYSITPGGITSTFANVSTGQVIPPYPGGDALVTATGENIYGLTPPTPVMSLPGGAFFPATNGVLFSLSPTGMQTILFAYDSSITPSSLVTGPDGHFYGTTASGGSSGLGGIIRF